MRAALTLLAALGAAPALGGQATPTTDSVVVVAIGGRYAAGWLRRTMLGTDYRDLWTTPITVRVLDLARHAGGLTPVSRGGGQQTMSLRFHAGDGRDFYFRSIDKDPSPNLPPELRNTVVAAVVQDQTSSAHPTAPMVVARLLEAAGVLHADPELFILPDDARLGEHRADFAGVIGMLEPRIGIPDSGPPPWEGAAEIIGGHDLFRRVEQGPDDRVDPRALLRARLVDILVGDWDRHRDQWSWVRFGDQRPHRWQPIPRDRDFALVDYDGLLLGLARTRLPQLVEFAPDYPGILGLTWNGRELDRQFLTELDRPVWDTVVAEVMARITDQDIDAAVHLMPPEHVALGGDRLREALRRRRDQLPRIADRFYRMLAERAELHGTDGDERVRITALDDQAVEVTLARPGAAAPFLRRRFDRRDTREIRLFLAGGHDSVTVAPGRPLSIPVRAIGGAGADVLEDAGKSGRLKAYDTDPDTRVSAGVSLNRRRWTPPPRRHENEIPPRDWGHQWEPGVMLAGGPDIGVLAGLSRTLTTYGFRKLPYASQHRFRAGIATGPWTYRADYLGRFRRENSAAYTEVQLRASGIEVLRFHGFGNEQPATGSAEFYRVTQRQFALRLAAVLPIGRYLELSAGPLARFVATDERAGRFLTTIDPYGDGEFGEVGGQVNLTAERRGGAGSGVRLSVGGSAYPGWWDVREAYGEAHGELRTTVAVRAPLDPLLLLRVGGKRVWGPYPFFDAAFIGGSETVRLGRENRYAGDAAVYGGAELRVALTRAFLGVPSDVGILGLGDVGRVYLDGESSSKWHGAAGGGVWVSLLDRANTTSLSVVRSAERTAVYFQAGFGF